ncbi:hypothetical protein YYC_00816 [Plasmodium yoelii 17X]|uniref:Uncharacterized protein n=4 Tax=Plasmodium yoelii TaxID=5861 RepID=A0AAF0B490_PLAYO|nr:conserved protein, unknown function [Plasmodium yoelii]ETB62200.1 hypothetical protein YYC_00816 [Plasmodium yoelii 17X]WBY59218.1 hypothetical protein Py17XNL_001205377 [Plasmodium yoelii yoelii]CDU19377.1 conserved Plasmodium protein, unknown function [Plasmodium yoelii]VTZ80012.1 conserved protein, unknown function [Plasmodium yoelii]|eukprot:XP_022812629.1 conserved protein, unknown function [Plasmodium yoelii]
MNVDIAFDGNEYTYSGYSKNSLIEDKNYTLDYDKYVHFAFFVCYYISHIKKEKCSDTELLTWYLKTFKHVVINSTKKVKRTYFNLINNLIQDKCVKVTLENNKRYLTHNDHFILWAWKRKALIYDKEQLDKY